MAAKRFFPRVFRSPANPIPGVINGDKNAVCRSAIKQLKREGILPRRVRLCQRKNIRRSTSGSKAVTYGYTYLSVALEQG